jgi:uncharacterized protein (TIGR03545 family)
MKGEADMEREKGKKEPKKTKKPPKPAAIFRKLIAEDVFAKRYLGLVEQSADRAFLESAFVHILSQGNYALKDDLDRDSLLRLNKLAKAIVANRGLVKKGPLVLSALLAAGIVIFALFFMNPLLERAIESGLEGAFGARAEVSFFRLDLFRLRVSMRSLAVADRDEPMTNLFETGRIELRLDPASLLRGRVYIEEASAASIALGGPRAVSGALPEAPSGASSGGAGGPKAKKAASSPPSPPIVDFARFDAGALLEREKSKLASLAAYGKAGAAYDDAAKRWKDRASSSQKKVAELAAASRPLVALEPKNIKSPSDALKAASDVKAMAESAKSTAEEAGAVASGLRSDIAAAAALEKEARSALDRDFDYLKSFVDFRSGVAAGVLEPLIRDLLSDEGEKYFRYGERALGAALSLAKKSGGGKSAEKPEKVGLGRGRDVQFPSAALPRFRLGHLGASFRQEKASWAVDIREISSEPSLVPAPSSLEASMLSGRESAEVKAVLDLRKDSSESFSVDARAQGFSVDLGDSFAAAGIGGLKGRASGRLAILGAVEGGFGAKGGIELSEAAAGRVSGAIGDAIASGLASVKAVKVDVDYVRPRGGADKYSIRTNLDSILAKALSALAARYADKALADLKAALRDYAGKELEGKLGSKADLDKLLSASLGGEQTVSSIVKALGEKAKALDGQARDLESRAKDLGSKAMKGVKVPRIKP